MGTFVVPLAILGVGLIGEWLLGPKTGSTTAAPDGMPMLNSALRGQAIPVTFGANRVSAQVVWTKNFNAVRQQSSGKGGAKGGGSGGFGSAKGGGSAGVGYLYYWDMMFNFGMVDVPSLVTKGWLGADKLDNLTINAITAGGASGFLDPDPTGKSAHMTFTEAFFSPGYVTDDVRLENWSYFESQMGFACAWPSTCYIGFEQLELGQTPSVPQISIELTPTTAQFVTDTAIYDNDINPFSAAFGGPNTTVLKADGLLYELYDDFPNTNANGVRVHDILNNTEITLLSTTAKTDADNHLGTNPDPNHMGFIPVPYTPYFYNAFLLDDLNNPRVGYLLYKIAAGAISLVGCVVYEYLNGFRKNFTGSRGVGVLPSGEVAVAYFGRSINHASYLTSISAPADVDGAFGGTVSGDATLDLCCELPFGDNFLGGVTTASDRAPVQVGFAPDPNPLSQALTVFFYVDKARCIQELSSGDNTYIALQALAHPHGFMLTASYAGGAGGLMTWSINSFLKKGDGSFDDFDDAGLDSTGVTGDDFDDWFAPAFTDVGIIMMGRTYSDAPWKTRIKFFRIDGSFVADVSNIDFSNSTDWPIGPSGVNSNMLKQMGLFYDAGDIWFAGWRANTSAGESVKYVKLGQLTVAGGADVTPPYIIRRILTSPIFGFDATALFGFTITENSIDEISYLEAHNYCLSQGFIFSVTYTNQDNLLTILNELCQLYGGFLTERGGKIFFNTVSATDNPIRVIDNHHLVPPEAGKPPVKTTKAALEDGYNKIQFNYLDRAIDYKQNQVEASDEVDIDINGPRVRTYPARYVMPGSVAQTIATRALWANLYGRDQYSFTLGWKDADIRPGALVTLVDSFDATLQTGVRARITNRQETQRGRFAVQATREFPYIIQASAFYTAQASADAGYSGLVQAAQAPDFQTAYELPKEMQGAKALCYFGYNQAALAMGAQLYLSVDSGQNFILSQDQQPFILSGRFASSLENRPKGWVETNVDFWLFPTPDFNPNTPTFVQNYALDDVTQAIRAAGGGVLVVGSEAVAMQNLTLLGQNHYRAKRLYRGWAGSPISSHTSGDYFHAFGAGIFAHEITQDDIGTTLQYKIAPYNFAGHGFDISSIPAKSYTIKGLYWLPREQPRTRLWVDSAAAWPSSKELTGPYISVTSGGCDLHMTWPQASNDEGFGAGGFGAGTFGHFIETDSVNYRVDIASKNGVKVSSFLVDTGYFSYTLAQNSTDFNGFGQDIAISVTPFTVKGDGPVNDARSISLFW